MVILMITLVAVWLTALNRFCVQSPYRTGKYKPPQLQMLNAIKTDLCLLLECLKYQMKCPDSQKQALLTIVSICQQNGQNVEFFKEIGGVTFICKLFRSSHYSEVKETALFALGSFAESNESCKQTLCREEIFRDLMECLKHGVSLTRKRVAVYMLSVLVSNNRLGQSLAQATGCIEILLNLFSDGFPDSGGPDELLQLWASVSSALCGCVNNPRNVWLVQVSVSRQELAQPICSFIGMAVANNECAQECFASLGGLATLSETLARVVPHCKDNTLACKLATMITRTLAACIADNDALAAVLSKLRLVPDLLLLLSVPNLSPQDQLVVVMTLGYCTSACVEHQSQLLLSGGLSLMISLLTETSDEEVRKSVTFVLQTCKNITGSLGRDVLHQDKDCDLQRHWQSAHEILQMIQGLEKRQLMGEKLVKDAENFPDWRPQPVPLRSVESRKELWEGLVVRKVKGQNRVYEEESDRENILHTTPSQPPAQPLTSLRMQNQPAEPMRQRVQRQIFRDFDMSLNPDKRGGGQRQWSETGTGRVESQNNTDLKMMREEEMKKRKMQRDERGEETVKMKAHFSRSTGTNDWNNGNPDRAPNTYQDCDTNLHSPHIFKHPAPMKRRQQRQALSEDEMSLCSELLDREIERILITPAASVSSQPRCAGCVCGLEEVDSRSLGVMLRRCPGLCEVHEALQVAEGRLKWRQRGSTVASVRGCASRGVDAVARPSVTGVKLSDCMVKTGAEGNAEEPNQSCSMRFISLTPLKRPYETNGPNIEKRKAQKGVHRDVPPNSSGRHRERKNYSTDELAFLTEGVKHFGHSWNSILWTYPFQPGRTNVDLAKKYKQLKLSLAQEPERTTPNSADQNVC
ncbi:telomere repeats-binding bouquet formation protein 1 isoform X3 [Brachyhypopomus gauderio]|uniref:telomere repeats-binding bouquet formation protein 1 isoform X3 n=1 Tax=Brachyhypopomus gauderio TaxID=698409 RepID=UPI004041CD3A